MRYFLYCILLLLIACNDKDHTVKQPVNGSKVDSSDRISELNNDYATIDVSAMDMSYYPVDYPKMKTANTTIGLPVMRVIYSRPHKGGRQIFGHLLKYDSSWRLGANESTEIEFFKPVVIQGRNIPSGRFIIYCIPREKSWTIVLNSHTDSWGLRQFPDKDFARFEIPLERSPRNFELFTMAFEKSDKGANLIMAWDDVIAKLPINF